ncbi:restriction endonuclease [Rhodococcus erythropolis]|uniref:NaeI family type II restriction endonuclease n=1 Tax=Rhodococcus erythropolis TaxID=1833 RepID=UPI0012445B62|nr:NaeI family type II restriction endonuclease [Rhodococcus erythropolis]QEX14267.1 restriction endonuclease [Rhodococcus erythropolis]
MLFDAAPAYGLDPELDAVEAELYRLDPTGHRFATVLRDTLDQLYDGQHTGRWNFSQLHKTEKTHMGTLVEINLHREFSFADGDATDYRIAGVEIDCKYSMTHGGWTLPPEVIGHLALVVTSDDTKASWRAGIVRVETEWLNLGRNRDAKATLSKAGRDRIRWLWPDHGRLAPNLFLELDVETRNRIFNARAKRGDRHGQARTNELFRSVRSRIIRRAELATVAQQDDFMKRARSTGGARTNLQPEGILVLGHQDYDPMVAAALGLPIPTKGEFVSARVISVERDSTGPIAAIEGSFWAVARDGDMVSKAPMLPRGRRREISNTRIL